MSIPADKQMHLKLGALLAVGITADIALAVHVSPSLAKSAITAHSNGRAKARRSPLR